MINKYYNVHAYVLSRSVTSDSLWLCRLYPTKHVCLWNFPGKNTGVGRHSLLQRIFPVQVLNPGLLHCRQILYHWATWEVLVWPQFSSVAQSCLTLCNPMDCSTPGLPVHHQLPEFTQTHVHWVGDAIQPSHPLSSPSPPAFSLSQHQGFFSNESVLHIKWSNYWSFSFSISPSNEYLGLISYRMDWLDCLAV